MNRILISLLLCLIAKLNAQLIPFRIEDKWGYSDTAGQILIKPVYDFCDFFHQDLAFVKIDSFYYGINPKGEKKTAPLLKVGLFKSGHCPVMGKDSLVFYINSQGIQSISHKFTAAENFSEGLAIVSLNKKLGIIDSLGLWVRKPDFDTSSLYFKSGFLLAISKGKYFYINRRGQTLNLPDTVLPGGVFSEGLAPVYVIKPYNAEGQKEQTSYLEFIDSSGKIVLSGFSNGGFDYSAYLMLEKEFRDGKAIIKTKNEIGWDYYFLDKKKRFSPLYASARHVGDSLFVGAIGYYMSDIRILDSNYYVMGQFQNKPTQVGEFGNGLLPVRNKDGNWGYMDANCNIIIPFKYSEAYVFSNGYAFVKVNGKFGVINTAGKEYFYDKKQ